MRFDRRFATWVVTGFLQQTALVGLGAAAALILVAAVLIAFGSLAIRAALPSIDRAVERGWAEALGPLSTLADRYPRLDKNASARQVEVTAAGLGISLAAENDSAAPVRDPRQAASFAAVRLALIMTQDRLTQSQVAARNAWLRDHRDRVDDVVETIVDGEGPVWSMDVADCVGGLAVRLPALVDLQWTLLAAAETSIALEELDRSARLLEASWRLNDSIQRSPRLEEHVASVAVVERMMAVLRSHPNPGGHWKVRLAALDLERRALEAVRLDAWLLRCRAARLLDDLHPILGVFAQPFARLLAVPQHRAMVWAVEELPSRDVRRFEPDRFTAEQHRRIARWNTPARSGLPEDWRFWPRTIQGSLAVELTIRTLDLRGALRTIDRFHPADLARRQPSRVAGLDWSYSLLPDRVEITLEDGDWLDNSGPALRTSMILPQGLRDGMVP